MKIFLVQISWWGYTQSSAFSLMGFSGISQIFPAVISKLPLPPRIGTPLHLAERQTKLRVLCALKSRGWSQVTACQRLTQTSSSMLLWTELPLAMELPDHVIRFDFTRKNLVCMLQDCLSLWGRVSRVIWGVHFRSAPLGQGEMQKQLLSQSRYAQNHHPMPDLFSDIDLELNCTNTIAVL